MDAGIEPGTAALQSGVTPALSRLSHHIHHEPPHPQFQNYTISAESRIGGNVTAVSINYICFFLLNNNI
jgi:hypothetical protein